ncbi:sterol desaturase family protein [Sinomicrobium sp. M5D2P17]
MLTYLEQSSDAHVWLILLLINTAIYTGTLATGWLLLRFFGKRQAFRITRESFKKTGISLLTVGINTVITYVGYLLWQNGWMTITTDRTVYIIADFLVLFLGMDLLMYVFHLFIHRTFLYRAIHGLHHTSENPVPLDLFVLHPLETIGFGLMWLSLLMLYPPNLYAVILYLTANVIFGLVGHLGMDPLPGRIRNWPLVKYIGTSSFHHNHHLDIRYNFGFYTNIWDRLFGTWKKEPVPVKDQE